MIAYYDKKNKTPNWSSKRSPRTELNVYLNASSMTCLELRNLECISKPIECNPREYPSAIASSQSIEVPLHWQACHWIFTINDLFIEMGQASQDIAYSNFFIVVLHAILVVLNKDIDYIRLKNQSSTSLRHVNK